MVLTCRYYAQKLPEIEEVVLANVRSIQEMGAYVDLQEYNGIEGLAKSCCFSCFLRTFGLSLNYFDEFIGFFRHDSVVRAESASYSFHQ